MADTELVKGLLESAAGEWAIILSLVFGGCCSSVPPVAYQDKKLIPRRNVWALEAVLKDFPNAG